MSKPTKIRLLNDIPFAEENGLTTGKTKDVIESPRLIKKPMGKELWVRGDDGDDYRIYEHEYEVVEYHEQE